MQQFSLKVPFNQFNVLFFDEIVRCMYLALPTLKFDYKFHCKKVQTSFNFV